VNKIINVHEAKTTLSRLLTRVEAGEEVVIARGGKPIAKLVPIESRGGRRGTLGLWAEEMRVPPSFCDPLPEEEIDLWYHSVIDPTEQ
jgi:prevent-host-death family protein